MAVFQALGTLQTEFFPNNPFARSGAEFFKLLNNDYYSQTQSDLEPAAIFLPKSAKDVATFVRTIKPFALDGSVPFAIRSGGQHTAMGSSNIGTMGITVDLRMLADIAISSENNSISIGAGVRWQRVYKILTAMGLGVTGSRTGAGGIGGVALSGGMSFFSSREGLICDNVINYEIVLSTGEIVNANARDHADLWRALRGGGNNFGIVTRFVLRTFKQDSFVGGGIMVSPSHFPHLIKTYCEELNNPYPDKDLNLTLHCGYNCMWEDFSVVQIYYTRDVRNTFEVRDLPKVISSFIPEDDSNIGSLRVMTMEQAANEQAEQPMEGFRCAFMNTTVKADAATLITAANLHQTAYQPLTALEGITCNFVLQAYPISLLEKCDNSLGLDTSHGPLMSIYLVNWWKSREDDDLVINTIRDVLHKIEDLANAQGTGVPYKDMNYSHNFQDPVVSYGPERSGKMCLVSEKYDPDGLFQIGVPGGFKLV